METSTAISTYQTIRSFQERPLSEDHLDRILTAGRRAPSSKNSQRWQFIVCRDRSHLEELSTVGYFARHLAGAAAGVALVAPVPEDPSRKEWIMFDLGQVAENMLLAAWDLGIGGVHAAVYDEDRARRLLGYPNGYRCDCLLSFGYPREPTMLAAPPRKGGRRPLSDMVHLERW